MEGNVWLSKHDRHDLSIVKFYLSKLLAVSTYGHILSTHFKVYHWTCSPNGENVTV